jgi:hypothetical protein
MKRSARQPKVPTLELPPAPKGKLDPSKFKTDLSKEAIVGLFEPVVNRGPFFALTIDTLGVAKTVGKGRTNLTFIEPFIVQADPSAGFPPFATFDRTLSPHRDPAISMHFEPKAYGFTGPSSFQMVFAIECFGQCTFSVGGFAGGGTLSNVGTKVFNGRVSVVLGFSNVPANAQVHGFLEQKAGGRWNFFTVEASQPPIVIAVNP